MTDASSINGQQERPLSYDVYRILRWLLILLIIAGAITSSVMSSRAHRQQTLIRTLREQTGRLEVSDPSKIHVSRVPAPTIPQGIDPAKYIGIWQFWVYLPAGVDESLLFESGVPQNPSARKQSSPGFMMGRPRSEQEIELVTVSVSRRDQFGRSKVQIAMEGKTMTSGHQWSVNWNSADDSPIIRVAASDTRAIEPGEVAELLACIEPGQTRSNSDQKDEDMHGLRIILFDRHTANPLNGTVKP